MAVSKEIPFIRYEWTGTTEFPVTFAFLSPEDLQVEITGNESLVYAEDYEIDGKNLNLTDQGISKLEKAAADNSGKEVFIAIVRNTPATRDSDYTEVGKVSGASLNDNFDRAIMIAQECKERLDRCISVYASENLSPQDLRLSFDTNRNICITKAAESKKSADAAANSADAAANSALKSAESAANAAASAQKAGSTDFGIFSEYLVGHNPAWNKLNIDGTGGTVTVPINPSNGAYQCVEIDDNGTATKVILSPVSDGATSDDPPFVMLAVEYYGEASSLYFAYDGDYKEPVFITDTAGTYIVTMYRISFNEGATEQWYIGNWSRIHELTMNYEV